MSDIKQAIRTIPDWPAKGVMFRDITTLLQNPCAFREVIDCFYDRYRPMKLDAVLGIDARGLIFGAPLAYRLEIPFVPIRKKGKLPFKTISQSYALEYGQDSIEIHEDAFKQGARVLIMDDLIATGGTIKAAIQLVEKLGGQVVECAFVIDLPDLKGKEKIKDYPIFTLVEFEGE
jgi:adenine phosphoribosyltransferase